MRVSDNQTLQLFPTPRQAISHYEVLTFRLCKLRYKLFYIDKRPEKVLKPYLYVGTLIHSVLAQFLREPLDRRTLVGLRQMFSNKWDGKAFDSQADEEIWLTKAKEILTSFFVQENRIAKPFALEQGFRSRQVTPGGESIVLVGRVDRIDELERNVYEVIDYKSFERPKTVEGLREDLGYAFFFYGARSLCGGIPPRRVTYYYLGSNEKVTIEPSEEDTRHALQQIADVLQEINSASEFPPTRNIYCGDCAFGQLCIP